MKKLLLAGLALAGMSTVSQAAVFQFDPERDGTFVDVEVMNHQLLPNGPVDVKQYFGR